MSERPAGSTPNGRMVIKTPDQRLRVFVSSTLQELSAERAAAREAIRQLRLTPVMFELGARPHPPRDLYRAYLGQSHVFVGIYWQRYGWVAPGEEVSGLEDEYALSAGLPKLIYIKEADEGREPRLEELLARVRTDDTASYRRFGSADELQDLIQDDLALLLTERFEQVSVPDRSRERPATNLPVPLNPLVGRKQEMAVAGELLRRGDVFLVTLVGPGGAGKSRLGLEIALDLVTHYRDGAFLVPLESIRDPGLVVPAISETLRVRETPGEPPFETLCDRLRDAHLLLMLDNFEQVIGAAGGLSVLLERCPRLALLVTSRTPLRVRGEHQLAVPPLPVPAGRHRSDLENLTQYAAVELFIQRAKGVRPEFTVTDENAPTVAEICHRLDGLPLAIELAAARLKLLSPAALLQRMEDRFEVLSGGTRDLPERQQTLRRAIDWSFQLLDEPARKVFRRLAAFFGGSTLEAAEAVGGAGDDPDGRTLDLIAHLVDNSMVTHTIGEQGDLRIGMLDTMREYALERLREDDDAAAVHRRHAEWYLGLVERAAPHLAGSEEPRWAHRLRIERDNIREALDWARDHDTELGLRLCGSIWRFWEAHNFIAEGYQRLRQFLALPSPATLDRARALQGAAALAGYLGEYAAARAHIEEALPILEESGDERRIAAALNELGLLAAYEGEYPEGRRLLEESLALKRALGEEAMIANSIANLGLIAGYEGDHARARELHRESLAMFRRLDHRLGMAIATGNLAHSAMHLGLIDEALAGQAESLRLFREVGDHDGMVECLERLAMVANGCGSHRRAARVFGFAAGFRQEIGTSPAPAERAEHEHEVDAARTRLGPAAFEAEWWAGREMSLEGVIDLACAPLSPEPS